MSLEVRMRMEEEEEVVVGDMAGLMFDQLDRTARDRQQDW